MGRFLLVLCLVLFALPQLSSARTWYILADSTGDAPTIKAGMSLASSGDDVLVAPGTYYEYEIYLKTGVWLHSEWGPTVTIIDGQGRGSVVKCSNISGNPVIEGFTIRGGSYAGIHCYGSSPIIRDNVICYNNGYDGGGIYLHLSYAPIIEGNSICDNVANGLGGGMYSHGSSSAPSSPRIEDNDIRNNTTSESGGGLYLSGGSNSVPDIMGNLIEGNYAAVEGGGLWISCPAILTGNQIVFNSTDGFGGGIRLAAAATAVDSNTIENNTADLGGGVYCIGSRSYLEITRNVVKGNQASKGAGIYCETAAPLISGNLISMNDASNWGGGIYCYSDTALIELNVITGNSSGIYGGGLGLYSTFTGRVISNTIVGNAAIYGGGISCHYGADATVANNIVVNSTEGSGFYCHSASPVLSCNDIWENAGGDAVCGTDGGGNFSGNPYFCDPASGDYSLDEGSPCAPDSSPPDCGLIGALPSGCDYAGVERGTAEPSTWGAIKSMYR